MNITSLEVRGYRNLASVTINFEPDVTILIGENNSGKTNVLDALYAALRVNRTIRQGAFDLNDYHLSNREAQAGDAGPIQLTVIFAEKKAREWHDDILGRLAGALALDKETKLNTIRLQVKSTPAGGGQDEAYEWNFLNNENQPLANRRYIAELNALQQLRPFYQLGALRDVHKEFNKRSTYFSPFVTDPTFSDELRTELSQSLSSINTTVLNSHAAFGTLKENITEGADVVAGTSEVIIEAVPSRLSELLANASVSMSSRGGAPFPLESHGSGAQSIAVLSLFRAYVDTKLTTRYDELSRAILTLEEPEAHLHPSAIRMLWGLVSNFNAQVILTTHSGDLVGEVPLRCLRRVWQTAEGAKVFAVDEAAFDKRELNHLQYCIQAGRGELLFARTWLLVEGKTEMNALKAITDAIGVNLHANDIRLVECKQYGNVRPFIKLARQLGIPWHCLCDGDPEGTRTEAVAAEYLSDGKYEDHITKFEVNDIEAYLCLCGFDDIYLSHAASEKLKHIVAAKGTNDYANQVSAALIDDHKVRAMAEVCAAIKADASRAPALFVRLFATCARLAKA